MVCESSAIRLLTDVERFVNIHSSLKRNCFCRSKYGAISLQFFFSLGICAWMKSNEKLFPSLKNGFVKDYVVHMDGDQNGRLHETIVGGIEKPLVEMVLKQVNGNKTQAANILGINRNTLRRKIQDHKIIWEKEA
jgi:Fis family transcriptional regulator, factor for inversion stimulation protein